MAIKMKTKAKKRLLKPRSPGISEENTHESLPLLAHTV